MGLLSLQPLGSAAMGPGRLERAPQRLTAGSETP